MTHDEVRDLAARMLTCATYITSHIEEHPFPDPVARDACSLLIEAASVLEKLNPPPEPKLDPLPVPWNLIGGKPDDLATFTDPGVPAIRSRPVSKNACPGCDSRANKIVHRVDNWLELECPICGTRWKYSNIGKAKWL